MSMTELERLTRRYTASIIETLGPDSDVPAPDVNTNERVMAWIMDTYSMHHRHTVTAVVTGKPVEMGGSLGRREATGRGCMFVTREALTKLGMSLKGARVAVQGFGNVGSVAADLMAKDGAIIVAVSDKSGAVHNPRGLDIPDMLKWVKEHRQLAGYPKGEPISKEALLTVDCDVLVPAATENVITRKNAPQIKAKVICEGANGPTTAAADEILERKGVFVIPDILANAGGVTVSYFEDLIGGRGGGTVRALANDFRLDLRGVLSGDDVLGSGGYQHVAVHREELLLVEWLGLGVSCELTVLLDPRDQVGDVEPLRVVQRARLVRNGHDDGALFGHQVRGHRTHVPEPLHGHTRSLETHPQLGQCLPGHEHAPPPRRLAPAQ